MRKRRKGRRGKSMQRKRRRREKSLIYWRKHRRGGRYRILLGQAPRTGEEETRRTSKRNEAVGREVRMERMGEGRGEIAYLRMMTRGTLVGVNIIEDYLVSSSRFRGEAG